MGIVLAARSNGHLALGRMQEQLNVLHLFKLLHADSVESDFAVHQGNARTVGPCRKELTTNHLVAFQVEGTETAAPYPSPACIQANDIYL